MGLPAAILFAAFYFVPFIANLRYSLTKWDRITAPEFVGLRNFVKTNKTTLNKKSKKKEKNKTKKEDKGEKKTS